MGTNNNSLLEHLLVIRFFLPIDDLNSSSPFECTGIQFLAAFSSPAVIV